MIKLLIVGDMNSEVQAAVQIISARQTKLLLTHTISEAIDVLRSGHGIDMVLIDSSFEVGELTSALANERINTIVIAYGINASPNQAVKAIKAGAKEFLPLPPDEKLIAAILSAITDDTRPMIASSKSMEQVIHIADKVAKSDAHILITGESGTGKEVLAHYIHNHSLRKDKPFIRVNCAAMPENLIESELFGHEKGAFTGAVARRIGKFEEASGGTLLLDEISEMDVRLQAKLLRAIQEKEIDRLGGGSPVKIDLRIIAASNRNLLQSISKGEFREDLYFRLNVITINLPPLRERQEDISALAKFFINKYCKSNNCQEKGLSDAAITKLESHNWPGNIRELENTMHRAVLLSSSALIDKDDIMLETRPEQPVNNQPDISDTIKQYFSDPAIAANILSISISNLQNKLNEANKKEKPDSNV